MKLNTVTILKKKDLRMKRVNKLLLLFILFACCLLTGCSRPETINRSTLNNDFNFYSKALVKGRNFTFNQGTERGRKVSLSVTQIRQINRLGKSINQRQRELRQSTRINEYPNRLINYGDAVSNYLDLLKKPNVSNYTLINHFHESAKAGLKIVNNNLNGRPTNIFRIVIAADYADGHRLVPKNHAPKVNKLTNSKRIKNKMTQKKTVVLFCISAIYAPLVIGLVIAQPSKQSDTMDALTESSDHNLFDHAKAKGKKLFLQRITLLSFIFLCVTLLLINYYVRNN